MKQYYFSKFEDRRPYQPVKDNPRRTKLFQVLAVLTTLSGLAYFHWRWTASVNYDQAWFAVPLVLAETFSFIGVCLMFFDLWSNKDAERQAPPHYLSEIEDLTGRSDRPISIDVFIATYNEDAELVRYTIRDAKCMTYPYDDVNITIYVLDDGRRDGRDPAKENMKALCAEEGVEYLVREHNTGFKAGNLKNGIEHSSGDLFVILDADTRPFPQMLENTMGYFRKKKVAWVQTCHWFYDTTEAVPLSLYLGKKLRLSSPMAVSMLDKLFGKIKTGEDIFGSQPRHFYEVIQRRRNFHNASFCCGAGSVHRREAVMSMAVNVFARDVSKDVERAIYGQDVYEEQAVMQVKKHAFVKNDIIPFAYHVSEDLYSSMIVHSDRENNWESVLHPYVECRLLSPQDIESYVKQRTRYAAGSIDIALRDNPLFRKGLTWRQRLCYFHTVYSYFAPFWLLVFMLSPIIYFFSHALPVNGLTSDFLFYFIPFFILHKLTDVVGSWGVSQKRGRQYYVCLFWVNLQALMQVIMRRALKFNVTPKTKQKTQPLRYVWPHLIIIGLTVAGILYNLVLLAAGQLPSLVAMGLNTLWGALNILDLAVMVRAAYWEDLTAGETVSSEVPGDLASEAVLCA